MVAVTMFLYILVRPFVIELNGEHFTCELGGSGFQRPRFISRSADRELRLTTSGC